MKLPTFAEFEEEFNINKLFYDMEAAAPNSIKESYNEFTKEQYAAIVKIASVLSICLLREYHAWLSKKLLS